MRDAGREKYYRGWSIKREREVTAEAARSLSRYARAFFGATGLERVELYDERVLSKVEYQDSRSDDEIKAAHMRAYARIPFTTRRKLAQARDFNWEKLCSYDASGKLEGYTAALQGKEERGLMEVELGRDRQVKGVLKYYWEEQDELRYIFEYDSRGELVCVNDLMYGDTVSFKELRAHLPDPRFFESGFNLPREIAGTSIPQL